MKKILMALTIIGMIHYSADAQTKQKKHSNTQQNYKICKYSNGYAVCGSHNVDNDMSTSSATASTTQDNAVMGSSESMPMSASNTYASNYKRHNMAISYDDPRAPYEGLPSAQYDGPVKSDRRNLNYNQSSTDLPASDGSSANRR